jgi:hypothetical protein
MALLLIHPEEIISGDHGKRIMAGKDDLVSPDPPVRSGEDRAFYGQDRSVFKDRQRRGQPFQKLKRVKTGLIGETDHPLHRKWKFRVNGFPGGDPCFSGSHGLQMDGIRLICSIEEGRFLFKTAADGAGRDDLPVFSDGFLVGTAIEYSSRYAPICDQLLINKPVLGCDFGRGTAGLSASHRGGFQDDGLLSFPGQKKSCENSGHASADDCNFRVQISGEMISAGDPTGMTPN